MNSRERQKLADWAQFNDVSMSVTATNALMLQVNLMLAEQREACGEAVNAIKWAHHSVRKAGVKACLNATGEEK